MALAHYPISAGKNVLGRQPVIVRPLGHSGLSATNTPQAKGAPSLRNPLALKPMVSR